eukprot:TRINITY_DN16351_c0_g1_i1.p1 TRINITY_DN16351_c0_g1~~TRINITY_DN16351_c0_g1_i1.p1  ORF type:complete len:427 (-),score=81.42 TRINITY_DN16351_c0_g1_i1:412-1659(-)
MSSADDPSPPLDKRRNFHSISRQKFDEEGHPTNSSIEQINVEDSCLRLFEIFEAHNEEIDNLPVLNRHRTVRFLSQGLEHLAGGYDCLDASRPWLVYWILHSLELLGETLTDQQKHDITQFLAKCQNPDGGFGGGPEQISHLAPTYAAVNSLAIIGTQEAYEVVNRKSLVSWMDKLRCPDGSFTMHEGGEIDIRGVYCALSVANMLNIYTSELFHRTDEWLLRCQTYEGGFGGTPGMEAHGGYTFCGFAALMLMGKEKLCDIDGLLSWAANRQMKLEGGFQGRTNKLVDGCYSFWQGGLFPLLAVSLEQDSSYSLPPSDWLFSSQGLQEYLLICCQDVRGGLIDKPGKNRDFYHTCYTLSGLSLCQHYRTRTRDKTECFGDPSNLLVETHPVYNVSIEAANAATKYFNSLPTVKL